LIGSTNKRIEMNIEEGDERRLIFKRRILRYNFVKEIPKRNVVRMVGTHSSSITISSDIITSKITQFYNKIKENKLMSDFI
jgi:hypothetical protein